MPTNPSGGGAAPAPAIAPVPPRFQQGAFATALALGPLASLAGTWAGNGFNAIWRPDNPHSQPMSAIKRFLEHLQIGRCAQLRARRFDPLAFESVFGRSIIFKENTKEARKGHIRQSIGADFVGDIVAAFVLRRSIPFLLVN